MKTFGMNKRRLDRERNQARKAMDLVREVLEVEDPPPYIWRFPSNVTITFSSATYQAEVKYIGQVIGTSRIKIDPV